MIADGFPGQRTGENAGKWKTERTGETQANENIWKSGKLLYGEKEATYFMDL